MAGPTPSYKAWAPIGAIFDKLYGNRAALDGMNVQFRDTLYKGKTVWDYEFGAVTRDQTVRDSDNNKIPFAWDSGSGTEFKAPSTFSADLLRLSDSAKTMLNYVIGANLLQPGTGKATKMKFEFKEKNLDGAYSPNGLYGADGKADPNPDNTDVVISSVTMGGDPYIQITFWCPKYVAPAKS
jgi:hypothetical protein